MSITLTEHIYSTEDTLYQIVYDKRFRREIYNLKTRSDGLKSEEIKTRFDKLNEKYRETHLSTGTLKETLSGDKIKR